MSKKDLRLFENLIEIAQRRLFQLLTAGKWISQMRCSVYMGVKLSTNEEAWYSL